MNTIKPEPKRSRFMALLLTTLLTCFGPQPGYETRVTRRSGQCDVCSHNVPVLSLSLGTTLDEAR